MCVFPWDGKWIHVCGRGRVLTPGLISPSSSFPQPGDAGNYSHGLCRPRAAAPLWQKPPWWIANGWRSSTPLQTQINLGHVIMTGSREKTGSYNKAASVTHLRWRFQIHHRLAGRVLRWAGHGRPEKERCVVFTGASSQSHLAHRKWDFVPPISLPTSPPTLMATPLTGTELL